MKLCDFGTAAPETRTTPYPEPRVGTLWYRSPKQLQGGRSYGPGVDVWALGCVMVERVGAGLSSLKPRDANCNPRYRSPDRAAARQPVSSVMVELLTGKPLFGKADDEDELLVMAMLLRQEIVSAGPEVFSDLPEPLSQAGREVLRGLLCFDPEERLTAA
ncbi:hypothetical protein EJB05_44912, partial [Eragrostis curvula]